MNKAFFIKPDICKVVYSMYLNGIDYETILFTLSYRNEKFSDFRLDMEDIDDIITMLNQTYNI